jgi:hypothetical protein
LQPTPPIHFDLDLQNPTVGGVTFIVRSPLKPDALIPSLRRAAQHIDLIFRSVIFGRISR